MELPISELKDALGSNRYHEKQRSSKAFKIICDPTNLGGILTEMAKGPAQSALFYLEMTHEPYYAAVAQYMSNYLWKIEDPHRQVCQTMEHDEPPRRGISPRLQDQGQCHIRTKRTEKKPPNGKTRERANYSARDYMQRLGIVEDAAGETNGILVERGEVRIAERCAQTLLNTNHDQCHAETARWKNRIPPHLSRPRNRRESRTAQ